MGKVIGGNTVRVSHATDTPEQLSGPQSGDDSVRDMFHGHFWQDRGWHGKSRHAFSVGALIYALLSIVPAQAATLDVFGPPPPGDPSAYTGPFIGRDYARDFLATLPPANEGALEGSSHEAVGANNVLPPQLQESTNVPTNSKPSPLFGAQPFTQQMLLFEEFGTEPYPAQGSTTATPFPPPTLGPAPEQDPEHVAESGPAGTVLEAFLAQPGIAPYPTEFSNNLDVNPWRRVIEQFLGRALVNPPAEGRPPGQGWAHQRYNEFFPQVYYKTAQAGSRMNGGFRDTRQMHRYSVGEFGPGGLYHRVFSSPVPGAPTLEGSTNGLAIRIHPLMPVQDHKSVWTFDGTLPPKLLMVRYGQPVLMRHYNALPVDPAANRGFGLHTITTHEHNGHSPAESDGYANAFFFPGQFYDYRWPLQLAGYDSINTSATDPRAAFPCAPGETLFVNDATPALKSCQNGSIRIRGDWRETMSTHWFHDHMMDFTAQNVYKGNAVMMNYYSALDRGKEDFNDGVNLRLPSGTALPWGNRDYDVNLLLADKAWDKNGQLWFNIFNLDGFIGDHILTNWLYDPYLDVRARSYRFRILNGSVSRYLAVALVQQVQGSAGEIPGPPGSNVSYNRVPFHMIANDGNLMEHTVPFDGSMDLYNTGNPLAYKGQLPTQGIAERYDIIVNFGKHGIRPGDKLYFVNVLEHTGGRRPGDRIALEAILSEQYKPLRQDDDNDGVADRWVGGDPAVGKFLELRVQAYSGQDLSMNPVDFEPGKKAMIPLTIHRDDPADQAKLAQARHRTFEFVRSGGSDLAPWTVKTDNGDGFGMDSRRLSAAPQLANGPTSAGYSGEGTLEIWSIEGNGGWSHPVHVHFEEGVILRRGGKAPPEWEKWARKDVYRVGPEADSTESVEMAIRFREFAGTYMEHCHNTQHEDHSMLLRWDIEHPGQVQLMPSPLPTWDGVYYVDSAALPTFRSGDGIGPALLKPTGTIVINGGATVTNSKTATLTLSASSAAGAVTQMQFSKDGVNFFPLEPFAATRVVTLLPGDGVKTMTVRFRDSAGNVSASISASIVRDSVKPVGTMAFSTPDPATSAKGTLALTASDANGVTQMQLSKDGVNFFPFEPFAASRNVTLAAGLNTLSVRFRDGAGNVSAPMSASITRVSDTAAPTGTIAFSTPDPTTSATGTLALTATDAGGVTQMQFSKDGVNFFPFEPFAAIRNVTLAAGLNTLSVRFRDGAGNVSAPMSARITRVSDTAAPTGTIAFSTPDPTTSATGTLALTATDAGGVTQMQFSKDGVNFFPFEPFAAIRNVTLTVGPNTLSVRFKDGAGNVSAPVSASITRN